MDFLLKYKINIAQNLICVSNMRFRNIKNGNISQQNMDLSEKLVIIRNIKVDKIKSNVTETKRNTVMSGKFNIVPSISCFIKLLTQQCMQNMRQILVMLRLLSSYCAIYTLWWSALHSLRNEQNWSSYIVLTFQKHNTQAIQQNQQH